KRPGRPALAGALVIPAAIADAGEHAARRFIEFFAATIRNKNTRLAYYRAACHFFAWVEEHRIGELSDIEPVHVAAYIEVLQTTAAKPTVKLHLAAIRMLFDWLVVGQVLAVNPAHAVRGPKHVVRRGKTPVLTEEQARRLLESIDTTTVVGLRRPRADWRDDLCLRAHRRRRRHEGRGLLPGRKALVGAPPREGGKRHEMPAHHKLEAFIDQYLAAAGIREDGKGPLFRSAVGKTGVLTDKPMNRVDAYRMVRRRTAEAGFKVKLGCHVFRATGITAYLEAGGTLENAQAMAAHESPRTTKLYDRTDDAITLDEVERINI
ncbi:MAG: tyrosine-type recombinase/integrase, partial [Stellaceae bacterium]